MKATILKMFPRSKANRRESINRAASPLGSLLIAALIACFGLMSRVQAVVPAPDGCYPNFTTAEGCDALNSLTAGAGNTALGWRSLFLNSTGSFNTGVGGGALVLNNGDSNTAVGAAALLLNTAGGMNTAVGTDALVHNDTGGANTAVGAFALFSNTEGPQNTALGQNALSSNTTGALNTAIGVGALPNSSTGDANLALGTSAGFSVSTASHVICIGHGGANLDNTTWLANVYGVATQSGTTAPVIVSDGGQLGTVASSERFKKDVNTMGKSSEVILSLRPVTFYYKTDTKRTPQFGLIAEEVAKVNPALVLPDKQGKPYTVRYEQINAMLLNEFLKEHRKVQELESTVASLAATVKEQAAQIQEVSAQLEMRRPAAQMVVNKP